MPATSQHFPLEIRQTSTGLTHAHMWSPSKFCLSVVIRTLPEDDAGLPHATEHLVGRGSQAHRNSDSFARILHDDRCRYFNSFTYPFATQFNLESTSIDALLALGGQMMDGVFNPLLREEDFQSEIWRLEADSLEGILLNEMNFRYSDRRHALQAHMLRHAYEGTRLMYDAAGHPNCIPSMTPARVSSFHSQWYSPDNALVYSSGPFHPEDLNSIIQPLEFGPHPQSTSDTDTLEQRTLAPPYASSDALLIWRHPEGPTMTAAAELDFLSHYLWRDPSANFRRQLLKWSSSTRLAPATAALADLSIPLLVIGVQDPTDRIDSLRDCVLSMVLDTQFFQDVDAVVRRVVLDTLSRRSDSAWTHNHLLTRITCAFAARIDLTVACNHQLYFQALERLRGAEARSRLIEDWLTNPQHLRTVGSSESICKAHSDLSGGILCRDSVDSPRREPHENSSSSLGEYCGNFVATLVEADLVKWRLSAQTTINSSVDSSCLQVLLRSIWTIRNQNFSPEGLLAKQHYVLSDRQHWTEMGDAGIVSGGWTGKCLAASTPEVKEFFRSLLEGAEFHEADVRRTVLSWVRRAVSEIHKDPLAALASCCHAQLTSAAAQHEMLFGPSSIASTVRWLHSASGAEIANRLQLVCSELSSFAFIANSLREQTVPRMDVSPPAGDTLISGTPRRESSSPTLNGWVALAAPAHMRTAALFVSRLTGESGHTRDESMLATLGADLHRKCRDGGTAYSVGAQFGLEGRSLDFWSVGDSCPDRTLFYMSHLVNAPNPQAAVALYAAPDVIADFERTTGATINILAGLDPSNLR